MPPARGRRAARALGVMVPLLLVLLSGCDLLVSRSEGERLWRKHCADCHGIDGTGNTPRYMGNPWADLRDNSWKTGGDRSTIEDVVREGIFGAMPAHDELTAAEMRALVDYLYQLRGETG